MSNQSANQTEIKAVEAVGAVSAILAKTKRPYNRKPKLVIVEPVVVVPEPESEDDSSSDANHSPMHSNSNKWKKVRILA